MKVIDVSQHNGQIDFRQARESGVEAVMIRSSWGHFVEDIKFREFVRGCEDAGLPYGLYHYSYALNEQEMIREADGLVNLARQFAPRMPVAIDMEDADGYKRQNGTLYNKELNTEICRYTCQRIEEAGFYPMIYANLDWMRTKLLPERFSRYDLWLAQWNTQGPSLPCGMWQYTSDGSVPGIRGRVDLNIAYKNYPVIIGDNQEGGQNIQWIAPFVTIQVVRGVGSRNVYYVRNAVIQGQVIAELKPGDSLPVQAISAGFLADGYKWVQVSLGEGVLGYMQVDLDYLRFLI